MQVLAEAGMVLRDPPAMHLLASQVVNELHDAVAACQLPCERPSLGFLLQLMHLAVGAKEMLREVCAARALVLLYRPVGSHKLLLVWLALNSHCAPQFLLHAGTEVEWVAYINHKCARSHHPITSTQAAYPTHCTAEHVLLP